MPMLYSIVRTSGEGVLVQASSVELFEMQIRFIKKNLFGYLEFCDEIDI